MYIILTMCTITVTQILNFRIKTMALDGIGTYGSKDF